MTTILFADDDALLGDLVCHKLEADGHDVTVVDNGYGVLSTALRIRPDLIILDNRMPGLRGPEVLPVLKKHALTLNIPVLVLTSQTGQHDMTQAYRAGAADYMGKPFLPQDLVDRVARLLGSDRALQQAGIET